MATKYTRALLAPLVASSRSLSEVLRKLGVSPNGGYHRLISSRMRQLELDTSHFTHRSAKRAIANVPVAELEALVRAATSIAAVLVKLGLPDNGRPHQYLKARLRELAIETRHFRGSAWSRGETKDTHPSVERVWRTQRFPDERVFIVNGPSISGPALVRRVLARGWRYACTWCGISDWRNQPLVLHLDHINGVSNDHRLENLRLLCPNCHSQTDTYCNRKR